MPGPDPAEARRLLREASLELARLRRIRGASHRTWRRIARARARLAFAAALLAAALAEPALAGTPIFQRRPLTDVGSYASPTFADIDGDGDFDVFIGERSGNTIFHENTGSATTPAFAAAVTNPFGLSRVYSAYFGSWASPVFADLDGDGDLDAFVGEVGGNTIFFENTGTADAPAFSAPSTNPFGLAGVGSWSSPAFADIDADGDLDAFVGHGGGILVFFENTGTASAPAFAAGSADPFNLFDVGNRSSPVFVDIDDDGDLDAFIGELSRSTLFAENTGTSSAPAFTTPTSDVFGLPTAGFYTAPTFADIDGDGDFDGFTGATQGLTAWFENTGTASAPAFVEAAPVLGIGGPAPATPTLADLDGDGDLDAFVGEYNGRTIHFANTGTASAPAFGDESIDPFGLVGVGYYSSPAFADIDGDADLDLFTGELYGRTILFENTGSAAAPAFGAPSTNPFGLADVGSHSKPALADIDGDGDLDAFVGNSSGNTFFFENTGSAFSAAFAAASSSSFGLVGVGTRASPDFVDADGDGDLDAFVGDSGGNTHFFENTGSASSAAFAVPSINPFGLADVGARASPDLADIDADGDLDAVVGTWVGEIVFFQNFELGPGTCDDGLDNDGDGRLDATDDPGCSDEADTSERSNVQCDNGVDDDGDGRIDWRGNGSGDPDCSSLSDGSESPPPPVGCGIGPELLLLAPLLAAARRRRGG